MQAEFDVSIEQRKAACRIYHGGQSYLCALGGSRPFLLLNILSNPACLVGGIHQVPLHVGSGIALMRGKQQLPHQKNLSS